MGQSPGGVRIDLNCRTPAWCLESWRTGWFGGERESHPFGVRNAVQMPKLILMYTLATVYYTSIISQESYKNICQCGKSNITLLLISDFLLAA